MWTCFEGVMTRRLLVNWRIEAAAARRILPPGVRPVLVDGWAVAGLCLVKLDQLRPAGWPAWLGLASENYAARMGVEWDEPAGVRKAVLIFHRATASRANTLVAERAGFGVHSPACFRVDDRPGRTAIRVDCPRHRENLNICMHTASAIRAGSVFPDLATAERFFRSGECGYSPAQKPGDWHGARLHLLRWQLCPMEIEWARSAFIKRTFGDNAILDSAFIMRNIHHIWTACGTKRFEHAGPSLRSTNQPPPSVPRRQHAGWRRKALTSGSTPRHNLDFDRWF